MFPSQCGSPTRAAARLSASGRRPSVERPLPARHTETHITHIIRRFPRDLIQRRGNRWLTGRRSRALYHASPRVARTRTGAKVHTLVRRLPIIICKIIRDRSAAVIGGTYRKSNNFVLLISIYLRTHTANVLEYPTMFHY